MHGPMHLKVDTIHLPCPARPVKNLGLEIFVGPPGDHSTGLCIGNEGWNDLDTLILQIPCPFGVPGDFLATPDGKLFLLGEVWREGVGFMPDSGD